MMDAGTRRAGCRRNRAHRSKECMEVNKMKRIISLLIVLTLLMSCACQAASLNPGGTLALDEHPSNF